MQGVPGQGDRQEGQQGRGGQPQCGLAPAGSGFGSFPVGFQEGQWHS